MIFISLEFKLSFYCMRLNFSIVSLVQKYEKYISKNNEGLAMKNFSLLSFRFYFKKTKTVVEPVGKKLFFEIAV